MFSNRWERYSDAIMMPLRSAVSALAPYCRILGLLSLTQAARSGEEGGGVGEGMSARPSMTRAHMLPTTSDARRLNSRRRSLSAREREREHRDHEGEARAVDGVDEGHVHELLHAGHRLTFLCRGPELSSRHR